VHRGSAGRAQALLDLAILQLANYRNIRRRRLPRSSQKVNETMTEKSWQSHYISTPLIAAWAIVALITCFALSMIIVLPSLPISWSMLDHGIIIPRYGSVLLDRSSIGMKESGEMEEREGW
jgi:hypothetical protein